MIEQARCSIARLVSEEAVIGEQPLVAPPTSFQRTAVRSGFSLIISGQAPSPEQIERLSASHVERERAAERASAMEPLIERLREEIADAGFRRAELEQDVAAIDERLAGLSEQVAASGDAVRGLLTQRNDALAAGQDRRTRVARAQELKARFTLLAEHYGSDVTRLEFALESGHFFQQLSASEGPRCGRPLDGDEVCHRESSDFVAIERAARAELKKLAPRIADLQTAISDVALDAAAGQAEWEHYEARAAELDRQIREVATPTAGQARQRVQELAVRRRRLENHLLRFRELDRYLAIRQEAQLALERRPDTYRPAQNAAALRSVQTTIREVLTAWRFPVSDVMFDVETDDLVLDGKPRIANGKGCAR
jgi:chromosome segregation ATPase